MEEFSYKKTPLIGLNRNMLEKWLADEGESQSFRAAQIHKWLYEKKVFDVDLWTDIPGRLRDLVREKAIVKPLDDVLALKADDGTVRFCFRAEDGAYFESVLIKDDISGDKPRQTVCISSQSGCALGCKFCATGKMGFFRDLTPYEIVGQVLYVSDFLGPANELTNIVFMGMGEPLLNLDSVLSSVMIFTDTPGFGIGARRIPISTSGIVPGIKKLIESKTKLSSISLNTHLRRTQRLMPIAGQYSISEILDAASSYYQHALRWVTMVYVLLSGVNDTQRHLSALIELLKGRDVKVNLILFNEIEGLPFRRPPISKAQFFQAGLLSCGITATIRNSQGGDISASCGQLAMMEMDGNKARDEENA